MAMRSTRRGRHSTGPRPRPEALEDCEYVDFSPTKEFHEVVEHIKTQMS